MKAVMLSGILSLFISMVILAGTFLFMKGNLDYYLLLLGTAFLGAGFGFTITALNPFAYNLFPDQSTSAVTAMHVLLGLGTSSAALLLNLFLEKGMWYGAPSLAAIAVLLMFVFTIPLELELPEEEEEDKNAASNKIPSRLWLFALAVFCYGACEATFGNWGAIFLEKEANLSAGKAALGLTLFWLFIAIGRTVFTLVALKFSTKYLYIIAPFVVAVVFYFIPYAKTEFLLLTCMAVGGFAMSFLFPNSISSATNEFPKLAGLVSGILVASIQLGTGFSAQLIGILNNSFSLSTIFQFSAIYAMLMGGIIAFLNLKKAGNYLEVS